MKKIMLALPVVCVLLGFVAGCATYGAKGVMPDNSSLAADKRLSVKTAEGEGIAVKAYPLATEEDVKKYFDEDLLGKGILPIFVEIQSDAAGLELVAATLDNGGVVSSPMSKEDIYAVVKREWFAKTAFWYFTTAFGAPISAYATHKTNQKIQKDLESGKLLSMGKLEKSTAAGFLCFRIPPATVTLASVNLKLIFQKNGNGKLIEFNLGLEAGSFASSASISK